MKSDPDKIQKNIEVFDKLIAKLPDEKRVSVEKMMEEIGERFFTAPASTRTEFHDCFPGGLLEHTIQLVETLFKMRNLFTPEISNDSVLFVGLFHDLGKIGSIDGTPLYKPSIEQWKMEKGRLYDYQKLHDGLTHAQRSIRILTHYGVPMTDDEFNAILYHDGLFVPENIPFSNITIRLTHLLHTADYWIVWSQKEINT